MKELVNEDQADLIIALLCWAITLVSLGVGAYFHSKTRIPKKALWAQVAIGALLGPAVWIFWRYLYNPIEDHYGLDSLKALKINFFIALGFLVLFLFLHFFALRWAGPLQAPKGRK